MSTKSIFFLFLKNMYKKKEKYFCLCLFRSYFCISFILGWFWSFLWFASVVNIFGLEHDVLLSICVCDWMLLFFRLLPTAVRFETHSSLTMTPVTHLKENVEEGKSEGGEGWRGGGVLSKPPTRQQTEVHPEVAPPPPPPPSPALKNQPSSSVL
ncbi:unnamed protein product [Arctogadus glacialis]